MNLKTLSLVACLWLLGNTGDVHSQEVDARVNASDSSGCRPQYPPLSRRLGEQGTVRLKVFIGLDGVMSKFQLVESSGYPKLDEAAVVAMKCMKFEPKRIDGVAEAGWLNFPIVFLSGH